jgi:hypothetical protein
MKTPRLILFLSAMLIAPLSGSAQDTAPAAPPAVAKVDYATQVKPILENYCFLRTIAINATATVGARPACALT